MKKYLFIALAAALLTILSALVYGYEYGITPNHIQIIPFIEKLKDPSLFNKDYFVNTVTRFPSVYPYMMAFASRFIGLQTLHLLLFFIFKAMLLMSAYGFARYLFKSDRTAAVTMFLFAFSPLINAYSLIGHDPLMKTSFYQTSAVAPLALLAIWMFLKKRFVALALIMAGIYYVNALVGNLLLVLFLVAGGVAIWLALFAALMAPGAVWLMHLNMTQPLKACTDFVLYLKLWYTGHYFPSHFTAHKWYHFILISAFFIVFFHKGMAHCAENRKIKTFLFTLAAMWLAAYFFAEIIPVRGIILLQLLRSDVIFIIFGLIFASDYVSSAIESRSIKRIAAGGLAVLAMIEFSEPSYKEFIFAALLLVSYEDKIKALIKRISFDPARAYGLLVMLCGLFLTVYSGLSFFVYGASPKMLCMMVFSAMILLPDRLFSGAPAPRRAGIITAAVLIIAALSYIHIFEYRISCRRLSNAVEQKGADWKALQLWAAANTAPDAVFIAPLEMNGFRVFSKRPVFVDWVDGSAMHWTPGFEKQWVDRLRKLGITDILIEKEAPKLCGMGNVPGTGSIHRTIYERLTENDFKAIAKDYGAWYVIEEEPKKLSFEKAYSNGTFCVYKIR